MARSLDKFKSTFREEAFALLAPLDDNLPELESTPLDLRLSGALSVSKDFVGLALKIPPALAMIEGLPVRIGGLCRMNVKEAENNDTVIRGRALVAPGNKHALLKRSGARYYKVRGQEHPRRDHDWDGRRRLPGNARDARREAYTIAQQVQRRAR